MSGGQPDATSMPMNAGASAPTCAVCDMSSFAANRLDPTGFKSKATRFGSETRFYEPLE
jgi:hypothetical protein